MHVRDAGLDPDRVCTVVVVVYVVVPWPKTKDDGVAIQILTYIHRTNVRAWLEKKPGTFLLWTGRARARMRTRDALAQEDSTVCWGGPSFMIR